MNRAQRRALASKSSSPKGLQVVSGRKSWNQAVAKLNIQNTNIALRKKHNDGSINDHRT